MRLRLLAAATVAACLIPASSAFAGDPIMPLSQVAAGMQCTGYSVVQGTTISSFNVEVLDVIDGDPASDGPKILFEVSGPVVDETGVGPGFSGLADLLPRRRGREPQHRRHLAVGRRVRRQGRARDADRVDPRQSDRPAAGA